MKFDIPVYGGYLHLFVDYQEFNKYHKKVNGEHIDSEDGITCTVDSSHDILIGVFDGKIETLVHEIIHASMYIFQRCEIDPTVSNHEPFSYFVEYLYGKLVKHLKAG